MPQPVVYFDTLAYANKLKLAGVPANQAEVQSELLAEIFGERVATKQDIEGSKNEINQVIFESKSEVKQELNEMKQEIAEFKSEVKQELNEMKQEIAEFKSEVRQEIAEFKSEVKQELNEMKREITEFKAEIYLKFAEMDAKFGKLRVEIIQWLIGISVAQTALILSILKFTH